MALRFIISCEWKMERNYVRNYAIAGRYNEVERCLRRESRGRMESENWGQDGSLRLGELTRVVDD